jgi:hypothetical protein
LADRKSVFAQNAGNHAKHPVRRLFQALLWHGERRIRQAAKLRHKVFDLVRHVSDRPVHHATTH